MEKKVRLAFYKGKKGVAARLIAWWKKAKYTHAEVLIDNVIYSSSEIDGGVRRKEKSSFHPDRWEIVDIPWHVTEEQVVDFYNKTDAHDYDWRGIIRSQLFGSNRHNESKWFCSEWCAAAIGISEPQRYCPQALYDLVKDFKRLKK